MGMRKVNAQVAKENNSICQDSPCSKDKPMNYDIIGTSKNMITSDDIAESWYLVQLKISVERYSLVFLLWIKSLNSWIS